MKKLNLKLVGKDGNAFALMGYFKQEARKKGWTNEEEDNFLTQIATNVIGKPDPLLWSGSRAPRPDDVGPKLWSPASIEEFYNNETKPKCYQARYKFNKTTTTTKANNSNLSITDLDSENLQKLVIQFGYRKTSELTGLARRKIWDKIQKLNKQQYTTQIPTSPIITKIQQIAIKEWQNLHKLYSLPNSIPISKYKPHQKQILYKQRKILAVTHRADKLIEKLQNEIQQLGQRSYLDEDQILIKYKSNEVLKITVALIETFLDKPEHTNKENRDKIQHMWNHNHSKAQIKIMNIAISTAGIENNHSLVSKLLKLTKLTKGDPFIAKENTNLSSTKTKEISRLLGMRQQEITPIIQNALSKIRSCHLALQDLHETAEQLDIKLKKPEAPQETTKAHKNCKPKQLWIPKPKRQTKNNTLDIIQIIQNCLNLLPCNLITQIALRLLHEEPNGIEQLATTINFAITPTNKKSLATLLDVSEKEIEEIKQISNIQQETLYNTCNQSKNPLAKQLATLLYHNRNSTKSNKTIITPKHITVTKQVKNKIVTEIKPIVSNTSTIENTDAKPFYKCKKRKARRKKHSKTQGF